jgi:hypothetical protein
MRQMTDHVLETVKGPLKGPATGILDFKAKFNAAEVALISGGVIPAGRCMCLNSSGELILGVGNATPPLFVTHNSDDYDIAIDGGSLSSDYGAYAPSMSGGAVALSGLGGFELETSEFLTNLNYANNDPLTAPVSTGVAATMLSASGKLTNASVKPYASNVVGWVTRPHTPNVTAKNAHGVYTLRFWTDFLPKIAGITEPTWV